MAIEWTPDLAVGHEEIDGQHQELFRRANSILDAMVEGRGRDEVEETLDFLSDYVGSHFRAEERQMAVHGFKGIVAHKAEHHAFTAAMLRLRDGFRAGGPTHAVVVELERLVCGFLGTHILHTDQALASFLKQQRR